MISKEQIVKIAETCITDPSMFIVDVNVLPGNVIEVILDKDTAISIDDCILVSKAIESQLDREAHDFELNVYSAGLSEPLKLERQYIKNIGFEIAVVLKTGVKIVGQLTSCEAGKIVVAFSKLEKPAGAKRKMQIDYTEEILLSDIKTTKLVIHV